MDIYFYQIILNAKVKRKLYIFDGSNVKEVRICLFKMDCCSVKNGFFFFCVNRKGSHAAAQLYPR